MTAIHSTVPIPPAKPAKPAKPRPDYPLTYHPAGYWCKKIRGKIHYFGPRFGPSDPVAAAAAADAALTDYNRQADALHAGRKPRAESATLTVKDATNEFLNHKRARMESGELSPRSWRDYKDTCDLLVRHFGNARLVADLGPDDFAGLRNKMAGKWGPTRLKNTIQRIRSVFKFAVESDLIDRPIRFGPGFARPSAKTLRLHKAAKGPKLFSREEVRRMLDGAGLPLRTMILLGINCGFGNADCGQLPLSAVDLEAGIIDFPRPKTGIHRRCPMWPETVEAMQEALAKRKEPKDPADAGLVFITKRGYPWHKDASDSPVAKETAKLLKELPINGRQGLGFYTLRHTFRTVADEARDQPAADYMMGHEVQHTSSVYREAISDERLRAVSEHVRTWLFAATATRNATSGE
jgi:integrase